MESNFRNVLIILSAIIIGAIFIHGLWTIRKQKNPYKLKTKKDKVEPISREFDGKGFDQDGVGQVKVLTPQNNQQDSLNHAENLSQPEQNEETEALRSDPDETPQVMADLNTKQPLGGAADLPQSTKVKTSPT